MTRHDHLIKEKHQFLISNGALCKVWLKLGWRRYENIKCLRTEDDNDRQSTVSEQLIWDVIYEVSDKKHMSFHSQLILSIIST